MGFLTTALTLAVLGLGPDDPVLADRVALIEINHFYDQSGRHVFDQIIFYDWDAEAARHQVRAWRLLKRPSQRPVRDLATGRYVAIWHDNGVLRKVSSQRLKETWTQRDPELVAREHRPREERPELSRADVASN